ncbi:MAG: glycine oxidase ThiO [Planctomycetaceae bacterium]|nr:glycine oxidase ThiO [Planctomycetaceae bacterium]
MSHTSDVVIVGGGVIGLTTAFRLASERLSVTVVDRQQVGQEASWAGAGMLPPGSPGHVDSPEAKLRALSHSLWPGLTAELQELTGIDTGFRRCGSVQLCPPSADSAEDLARGWHSEGIACEILDAARLQSRIPGLRPTFQHGVFVPDFAQVRNPRHLKALSLACRRRGVTFFENCPDVRLSSDEGRVVELTTGLQRISAGHVCITAGAWTPLLLEPLGIKLPVSPVRGQIAQIRVSSLPFHSVVELGKQYLVPRPDGLILIGSTEERVGYEKGATLGGVSSLLEFAGNLIPALEQATLERSWSGLRPASPNELPFIGGLADLGNLSIACGHFRSGLQMSPGTAALLTNVVLGRVCVKSVDWVNVPLLDMISR